ncbi:MAG: hypothetical protein V3V95_07050, partial [Thermodesulfobacteriota bacterium]
MASGRQKGEVFSLETLAIYQILVSNEFEDSCSDVFEGKRIMLSARGDVWTISELEERCHDNDISPGCRSSSSN